jgi:hypothetical protein
VVVREGCRERISRVDPVHAVSSVGAKNAEYETLTSGLIDEDAVREEPGRTGKVRRLSAGSSGGFRANLFLADCCRYAGVSAKASNVGFFPSCRFRLFHRTIFVQSLSSLKLVPVCLAGMNLARSLFELQSVQPPLGTPMTASRARHRIEFLRLAGTSLRKARNGEMRAMRNNNLVA